jgi:hypothetical protein
MTTPGLFLMNLLKRFLDWHTTDEHRYTYVDIYWGRVVLLVLGLIVFTLIALSLAGNMP